MVAVGGNSLIVDAMHQSVSDQFEAVAATIGGVVDLIADGWTVAITHGNGPQVGFTLRRSELAMSELPAVPLDYADANSQGTIGYMFQRALGNVFRRRGIDRNVLTVVTQVLVDGSDPAMARPTKPIGAFMSEEAAREVAERDGWTVREDAGRGWRRVVSSPEPLAIVEIEPIKTLIADANVVVCCGGGGIPVARDAEGNLRGVRAVIDKDLTAALLARELSAELFIISTGVDRVALGYGTPHQRWLDQVTAPELDAHHAAGEFAEGSMEPKVRAVLEFIADGGPRAIITDPAHIAEAVAGLAGTRVESGVSHVHEVGAPGRALP